MSTAVVGQFAGGGARAWWSTRAFAFAALLLAATPLLWPALPPLTDLPGHLGRWRVMLDGGGSPLAQWYGFAWRLTGNLGGDLLVAALAPLLGLEPAVKWVTILAAMLMSASLLALSRAAHGRVNPFALFALPLVYNHAFHTGFLNFALSAALAFGALALWLSTPRRPVFAPIAIIVWLAHAFGWGVLALTCFAGEWARRRSPVRAAVACWPLAAPLPLMLIWRSAGSGATFGWFDLEAKAVALLMVFRDRWFAWDVASLAIVVAVLWLSARSKLVEASPELRAAALALLGAFVLLPSWLFGSAFADARAGPLVLMVALLALRSSPAMPDDVIRRIALAGALFLLARTASTTLSLALTDSDWRREAAAVELLPPGARVASLVAPNCEDAWAMNRRDHLGGVAVARARAFSNDQFPDIGASLLTIRHPVAGEFLAAPSQLLHCPVETELPGRIAAVPRAAFDHLWLIGADAPVPRAQLIWRNGASALYRLDATGN
jgi:hypothetical protein